MARNALAVVMNEMLKNFKAFATFCIVFKGLLRSQKAPKATLKKSNSGSITINSEENIIHFINNNRACLVSDKEA